MSVDAEAAFVPRIVTLGGAADFVGFRVACRTLWAQQVEPATVDWRCADDAEGDLFARPSADGPADESVPPLRIPAGWLAELEAASLHADGDRFALLYRFVWRLQSEPALREDALDADAVRIRRMAQAVRRDMHKMKAFVRFRTVEAGDRLHVAWFEPEHHVVEATAPFFARRFANMRWAILTPERSVEWDGVELLFGPGARRDQAPPADAGESLWLTYYESIFNPARLKVAMMKREMPVRYWKNLPEAERIGTLVAEAGERSIGMVERGPSEPSPRRAVRPQPRRGPDAPGSAAATPALAELAAALDRCRECPIGEYATQGVPGEGPVKARLMFVGEQPGDVEDLRGRPFVGPAGQLFDRALAQLGVERKDIWVTNAVKHFKFELRGKRRIHKTPAQQEAAACLHWLETEIGLVDPDALVALGATAARQLMGRAVAVTRERGHWLHRDDGRRVLVTLHPSALLRMEPADKEAAWTAWLGDLQIAVDAARHPRPR